MAEFEKARSSSAAELPGDATLAKTTHELVEMVTRQREITEQMRMAVAEIRGRALP